MQNAPLRCVTIAGNLLPPDLLQRILDGDPKLPGMRPCDFGLADTERISEAINRSWQRMTALWARFAATPKDPRSTQKNLLFPLFAELGYRHLSSGQTLVSNPSSLTTSHAVEHIPLHLLAFAQSLDARGPKNAEGKRLPSPHTLLQDLLNRSDDSLWGIVTNGQSLRLLRDSALFSTKAYLEFDLATIFSETVFADFALLWMLCHKSRLESRVLEDTPRPDGCFLEQWAHEGQESALVALDTMSEKVARAITLLASGFLADNPSLALLLSQGTLTRSDFFHELLRLIYRMLFCFVAEDRHLIHAPGTSEAVKERYQRYYSFKRLRSLARITSGTKHWDLYEGLKLVMAMFGKEEGCAALGISPMGSFLWSDEAIPHLREARLSNIVLLAAIRELAWHLPDTPFSTHLHLRPVAYEHLGAKELGAIYESLLESHLAITGKKCTLLRASGNDRKKTGSYYTPAPLIDQLLDSALDPVLDAACEKEQPELALLRLKICDPACGSGHFLLACAKRMGERLALLRSSEDDPSPAMIRCAVRDCINRSIYGVDANPMAVELCKVSLWMEAMEPGKPLSFLDHHIVAGNSLIGTNTHLVSDGVPDEAFVVLDGDDKKAVSLGKKRNALEKQYPLLLDGKSKAFLLPAMPTNPPKTLAELDTQEKDFRQSIASHLQKRTMLADLWCASFVMERTIAQDGTLLCVTQNTLDTYLQTGLLPPTLTSRVVQTAKAYQFFHWELAFPEVFAKKNPGFDVVLGNPPWERIKLQEKEWFFGKDDAIAKAPNASIRSQRIKNLQKDNPQLYAAFAKASAQTARVSHFIRESGRYPLCGRGDINCYAVFAETMRQIVSKTGRVGCILPSGIATDATTQRFFQDIVQTKNLVTFYDFENKGLFPSVHTSYRFALLTMSGQGNPNANDAWCMFFAHRIEDLHDSERRFSLNAADIALINPNTHTCPCFRSTKDAELAKALYRRLPVLQERNQAHQTNSWQSSFLRMFDMSNDAYRFRTKEQLIHAKGTLSGNHYSVPASATPPQSAVSHGRWLPLYEAKMVHLYNHRWAGYTDVNGMPTIKSVPPNERNNPTFACMPRYWVHADDVNKALSKVGWEKEWVMGIRNVTNATNERTIVGTILPRTAVGNSFPLLLSGVKKPWILSMVLSSYICDFIARLKISGINLNFFTIEQLPIIPYKTFEERISFLKDTTLADFLQPRILELVYTTPDMAGFAKDLGFHGAPFPWDEDRRFCLQAELDALFFHCYLPSMPNGCLRPTVNERPEEYAKITQIFPKVRDAVSYIMDTFVVKKKKDISMNGFYKTKETILKYYDIIQESIADKKKYRSNII